MSERSERIGLTRVVVRDGVLVAGADATTWLQGQISQDVESLLPGETRHTLVLSPQGKIDSFCRVTRLDDDRFLLDVEAGHGEPLLERLRRFKLRVKATLETVIVQCDEEAGGGYDALGPPEIVSSPAQASASASDDAFEAARIRGGVPRLGRELTERTIPQEAGDELVARSVSFTKGCYTGQELVARLDSRGSNVPRRLRLIEGSGEAPRPGDRIEVRGSEAGEVTSAVADQAERFVALGYVKRAFVSEEPLEGEVVSESGRLPATISSAGSSAALRRE